MDGDKQLLDPVGAGRVSASQVERNFYLMCVCFALNHGTVTALIGLAAPELGNNLGNASNCTLYAAYTIMAMFAAAPVVHVTGHKGGLVLGLSMYCFYVVAFFLARFDSIKSEAVIIGSFLGGCAAGFLWTAQGGFFSSTCQTLAKIKGVDTGDITTELGGKFAFIYLAGEVIMKVLATTLKSVKGGAPALDVVFGIVAIVSALGMTTVRDYQHLSSDSGKKTIREPLTTSMFFTKALAAVKLLFTDPKMICLYPAQVVFGFMGVYLNGYANSHVVTDVLGNGNDKYVGVLTAIVAAVAAVVAGILGKVGAKIKLPLMVMGACVWTGEALLFMQSNESLGTWGWCVLLYSMHGIGRAVWESTNKTVFADFFADQAPAAFANVIFSNGLSGALGFLSNAFPPLHLDKSHQLWICFSWGAASVIGAFVAFAIFAKEQRAKQAGGVLIG